jgi:amino acid adenylation domain-containing protein
LAGVKSKLLQDRFLYSVDQYPEAIAIEVAGDRWSYRALHNQAARIAATLRRRTPSGGEALTAVFAHRSATAFSGILGALMAGTGYVPLNRHFPSARTRSMLHHAGCRSIVCDQQSLQQLNEVLEGLHAPILVIAPDTTDVSALASRYPIHAFVSSSELEVARDTRSNASPESIAYVLFTSGSTGTPKAVAVTHGNVTHFVNTFADRYQIASSDRFSQMFDATFDLSIFDLFVAWSNGACVCCPMDQDLLNPSDFILTNALTVWASVPSMAAFMKRFGMLKPGSYPSLRLGIFCGEPLPVDVACAWMKAAPFSVVENLYGPTELTVACTSYRCDAERTVAEAADGIVPIGWPTSGMQALVVDEALREVEPGSVGELMMCGPQLTPGYWRNQEATEQAFVRPPGSNTVFYRTGDRVRRPVGATPLTYVGRLDHQIKVLGHRVELGEIESRLREQPGVEIAAAVGWPPTSSGAAGVVAFVAGRDIDPELIRSHLTATLPQYAVPRAVHVLKDLPLNSNGKVDRAALVRLLGGQ